MKIALCLFGQPRFINHGFNSLKRVILDRFDTDVYIHTWDSRKMPVKPFHYGEGWKGQMIAPEDTERYIDLYKPMVATIDPPEDYSHMATQFPRENTIKSNYGGGYDSDEGWPKHINASFCMWKSIRKASQMVDKTIPYDRVIFTRSDIGISNYDPTDADFEFESLNNPLLCNNWFNAMNPAYAGAFGTIYDLLGRYYEELGGIWCNEMFVRHFLNKYSYNYVERGWGLTIPSFRM